MTPDRRGQAILSFCLCADDFALAPGVSRGILEALDAKRLSATSVMTTRPYWPEDARRLHPFRDKADIGLHLNLTLGAPLGAMPAFAPSGQLPDIRTLIRAARTHALPETEIAQEISRQLDQFSEHADCLPAFIDGHQHVQILPRIRSLLLTCLEQKGLAGKVWLRTSFDYPSRILRRGIEVAKALGVAFLARGFAEEAAARGFLVNDGFAGFSAFDPRRDYGADFAHYLRAPGARHLIMCHPGYCDDALMTADPVTLSRERELRFLLSPSFTKTLGRAGARLIRLSDARL